MKMVVIVYRDSLTEEIHQLLKTQKVNAFTEIPSVQGTGETGTVLGMHYWPGHNSILFAAMPDAHAQRLTAEFAAYRTRLQEAQHGAEIPMKLFVLPVEQTM